MIGSFRSKVLQRYWEKGDVRGLRPDLVERIDDRITLLAQAEAPEGTNIPGVNFHSLRGKPQRYALWVNKNWRITFGWDGDEAIDIDLEDYH